MADNNVEYAKIQVRRGQEVDLPLLDEGEPGFTTDSHKPFIGTGSGNIELAKKRDVDSVKTELDSLKNDTESFKDSTNNELTGLQNQINSSVSSLQNQINSEVDTLQKKDSELQNNIDSLDSKVETKVTELRQKDEELSAQLAKNTQDFINLGKTNQGGTSDKDNYSLLTSLVESAKANKKGLYIPNGRYYCSQDMVIDGIQNIQIDGDIVMATGKTLEITYTSQNPVSCNWHINTVTGKLRITGIKNANVKVIRATELELYANGDVSSKSSIAYCQFHLGLIDSFRIFSEGSSAGWINENIFFGGRIKSILIDGNYAHSNNTFYKPMLEGCTVTINRGYSNVFHDVRFESNNTLNFAAGTFNNIFYKNWFSINDHVYTALPKLENLTINDSGSNQVIRNNELDHINLMNINIYKKPDALTVTDGKVTIPSWTVLLRTDLIELPATGVFGLDWICDVPGLRTYFTFYNEQKTQITGADPMILKSPQNKWNSSSNLYEIGSNTVQESRNLIDCSKARYMKISIMSGIEINIKYFKMTLIKSKHMELSWLVDAIQYFKDNPASA